MPVSNEAARNVHANLLAIEEAIDRVIEETARMPLTIAAARVPGVPFGVGQGALANTGEALALAIKARQHVARTHEHLRREAEAQGVDPTAFGDVFDCPPATKPSGLLQLVA